MQINETVTARIIENRQNERKKSQGKNKQKKRNRKNEIKIIYANVNGIKGKDASLQSAAEEYGADIICINETKTAPPRIQGYANWTHKQRPGKEGGGVAITTKEKISNKTTKVENIEDHDQEVIWIEIKTTHNNKIYIGTYYGKQEKEPRENIEREFSQLESQMNKLQREAPIVLIGDFNAKIEINKRNAYHKQSPNGKHLQQLIDNQNLIPINTTSDKGAWTRVNRKNPKKNPS